MTRVLISGVKPKSRNELLAAVGHYAILRFAESSASKVDYRWADVVVLGKFGGHRRSMQAKQQCKVVVFAPHGSESVVDAVNLGIDKHKRKRRVH